jgi:uncharacterized repeat protein (TIGR01451 family)
MRKRSFIMVAVPLIAGSALIATAAGASVHSKVYDFADMSVSIKALPSTVSAGRQLAFDVSTRDNGPNDATGVTVTIAIPGGTTFVSATSPAGGCVQSGGSVACALGSLQVDQGATVRLIVQTSSAPGGVQTTARVSADQTDFEQFNDRASASVSAIGPSTTQAAAFVPATGGSVSTGTNTTLANPNATTVKIPSTADGVAASIVEAATTNPTKACGTGYTCHGQVVELNFAGGTFVTTKPVRLTMRVDGSALGGANPARVPVFRNKALISKCKTAGIAKPAPCVESRTVVGGGDVKIVVLTVIDGKFRA